MGERGRQSRGPKRARRGAGAFTLRLHSISLQNFKSFKDETTIPLGQITHLIGPNGAGKSNVLHGIKALAVALAKDDYAPEPGDYFDNNTDQITKLAAAVELSEDERQSIASRIKTRSFSTSRGDLGNWLFKRLKYVITFNGQSKTHTIFLTFRSAKYHVFVDTTFNNDSHTAKHRSIEMINVKMNIPPRLEPYGVRASTLADVFEQVDESLLTIVADISS